MLFLVDEVEVQLEEAFLISLYQFAGQLRFARVSPAAAATTVAAPGSFTGETAGDAAKLSRRIERASLASGTDDGETRAGVAPALQSASAAEEGGGTRPVSVSMGSVASERPHVATKWYFQEFEVREIRVNLTYRHGEHILSDAFSKGNPMIMLMQNLDRMPLVLHRFPITHRFEAPSQVGGQIAMTYKRELLKQVYKILLHIDLLGNPLSLTRGLAAGFKDFLTMPAEGLLAADAEMFVRGLGKGTWSLAKGVIGQGVLKTGAQVSSALGRTLATFSFDSKYVREREMQNAHHAKPTHIGQGLLSGAWALASGVGDGVAGLFTAPLEGAREKGLGGMLAGFGRGAAGLVVKPLAGGVDFVSKTMEGGANTFDFIHDKLNDDDLDGSGQRRRRRHRRRRRRGCGRRA